MARDGLAREETNLVSYTEQLARPFEHNEALLTAQHDLARIECKLALHAGPKGPPRVSGIVPEAADEVAA